MKRLILTTALLLMIAYGMVANANAVCGDASGDETLNILDLVWVFEYLNGSTNPEFNAANADCDGVTGVTVSDAVAIAHNIFTGSPLNCSVSGSYSFAAAPNDTIFLPRLLSIPDSVDVVHLLVYASFSEATTGYYLPFLKAGTGSNNLFELATQSVSSSLLGSNTVIAGDTATMLGIDETDAGDAVGSATLSLLRYNRVTAGSGNIAPEAVDRSTLLRVALERNSDLVVPVVAYYDAALPFGNTISASPNAFDIHATVGDSFADTVVVDFDHIGHTDFYLSVSASWITIDGWTSPNTIFTSPTSIGISADPSALGVLDYIGVIRMHYSGISQPIDSIIVNLHVHPESNQTFPYGDFDCDGELTVADLMYFVNFLFRGGPEPFPCQ